MSSPLLVTRRMGELEAASQHVGVSPARPRNSRSGFWMLEICHLTSNNNINNNHQRTKSAVMDNGRNTHADKDALSGTDNPINTKRPSTPPATGNGDSSASSVTESPSQSKVTACVPADVPSPERGARGRGRGRGQRRGRGRGSLGMRYKTTPREDPAAASWKATTGDEVLQPPPDFSMPKLELFDDPQSEDALPAQATPPRLATTFTIAKSVEDIAAVKNMSEFATTSDSHASSAPGATSIPIVSLSLSAPVDTGMDVEAGHVATSATPKRPRRIFVEEEPPITQEKMDKIMADIVNPPEEEYQGI